MELIVKILLTLILANTIYLMCVKLTIIEPKDHPFINIGSLVSVVAQIAITTYLIWR